MDYRPLGRTGASVSQLCLGAMMFGAFGNPDHDESVRIIHKALDAGINFIDTADGYSAGESEVILGKALAGGRRNGVILAVKFGLRMDQEPNRGGAGRRWIAEAVEDSLRRLQTDWIDLYQVGVPDPSTDIDETLGALSDLVHAGKIRSIGASKVPPSEIVEAQWVADRRGHERFRTEQPPYSLLTRAIEYDLLPTCQRHGDGCLGLQPIGWRMAVWEVPQGPRHQWSRFACSSAALPGALGRHKSGQRGQVRSRRCARSARRRSRFESRTAGSCLRRPPSRCDLDDHRSADNGALARVSGGRWH